MRILKKALAVFCLALILGGGLFYYVQLSTRRTPSSIETNPGPWGDIKNFKTNLINSLKVASDHGNVGVSLDWQASYCDTIDKVELVLEVDGMTTNGDPVQIVARKDCSAAGPMQWLLNSHLLPSDDLVLNNVPANFPKTWVVKGFHLISKDGSVAVSISVYEIIFVLGQPVLARF